MLFTKILKKINEKSELKPNSIHGVMHLIREEIIQNSNLKKLEFLGLH